MSPLRLLLLAFSAIYVAAQQYAIAPSCGQSSVCFSPSCAYLTNRRPILDTVEGRRDGIITGVQEAIDHANNAFRVLSDHAQDEHVQSMTKLILGEDDLNTKLQSVMGEMAPE